MSTVGARPSYWGAIGGLHQWNIKSVYQSLLRQSDMYAHIYSAILCRPLRHLERFLRCLKGVYAHAATDPSDHTSYCLALENDTFAAPDNTEGRSLSIVCTHARHAFVPLRATVASLTFMSGTLGISDAADALAVLGIPFDVLLEPVVDMGPNSLVDVGGHGLELPLPPADSTAPWASGYCTYVSSQFARTSRQWLPASLKTLELIQDTIDVTPEGACVSVWSGSGPKQEQLIKGCKRATVEYAQLVGSATVLIATKNAKETLSLVEAALARGLKVVLFCVMRGVMSEGINMSPLAGSTGACGMEPYVC